MTFISEAARSTRIEDLLAAQEGERAGERITLPWQDERGQTFPVIKISLDHVVFNPRSHRIREQLESHEKRAIVEKSPFTEAGQKIITEILSKTDGYEDLKANLREYGQNESGVITRAGVLINANTRAVALREINPHGFIRVAVLPKKADPKDIAKLELTLQMRRDFKQEYTFVNQLLFVEDLKKELGYNDEDVAKAMNLAAGADRVELRKGTRQAQQRTRLLALIREIQYRSGNKIPLNFFDDQRVAFEELDTQYEDLKARDLAGAQLMKEGRILAMLSGTQYRNIRRITAESVRELVVPELQRNDEIGGVVASLLSTNLESEALPGLDELIDDSKEGGGEPTLRALVDVVAKSWNEEVVTLPSDEGEVALSRDDLIRNVAESLDDIADEVERESKASKRLTGPIVYLREARRSAQRAFDAYQKVASNPKFKDGSLDYELKKLSHAVEALRNEIEIRRK